MPIFRKIVTETSTAIFDIEANSQIEADNKFDKIFKDPDMNGKYDEYRDLMNSQCKETILDGAAYKTRKEYNKAEKTPCDFFIDDVKNEPKYDLYLKFDDQPNVTKAYLDLHLSKELEILREINEDYILRPTIPNGEAIKQSIKDGARLIYYVCERRN